MLEKYEKSVDAVGGHEAITPFELLESLSENYLTENIPIYITVEADENFVKWKNFNFPDPKSKTAKQKFGEFIFESKQYFDEIEKLKQWVTKVD